MQADDFPSRFMKRIKITHKTVYHYRTPVTFGPHRALIRPREGHDVHIASSLQLCGRDESSHERDF
jgi:transglutaminase-like putative cysteine protease